MSSFKEEIKQTSVLDPGYLSIHIQSLRICHTIKTTGWVKWAECAMTEITEQKLTRKEK